MPLIRQIPVRDGSLSLWRMDESVEALLFGLVLSPSEQACFERIARHSCRSREWLAARTLIRTVLGPGVSSDYDEAGRPVLVGHEGYISLSHSENTAVLYHSSEPCGVDIERCSRPFERTAARFASPAERALTGASLPLVWCLKEAAYKWARTSGLDLLRDLRVEEIEGDTARVRVGEERAVRLGFECTDDHCLAWTLPGG